jgi:hypothetical protein
MELVGRKNKFNTMEMLDKFKIHSKIKAKMNIPFCRMVIMPIICLALKMDVMKMEQVFQMGCKEGERVFYISPQNW